MIFIGTVPIILAIGALGITYAVYALTRNEQTKSTLGILHMLAYGVTIGAIVILGVGCAAHCLLIQNPELRLFPEVVLTSSGLIVKTHIAQGLPLLSVPGFTLDIWGLMILTFAISLPLISFALSRVSTRRLLRHYARKRNISLSNDLGRRFGSSKVEVMVCDDDELDVFSIIGSWQGKGRASRKDLIVINEKLVSQLDEDELETVIAHEVAHVEDRDVRFYPLYKSLGIMFFFDPVIGRSINRFVRRKELKADRKAATRTLKPLSLARALIKIHEGRTMMRNRTVTPLMGGKKSLLKERIDQLLRIAEELKLDGRIKG